MSAGVHAIVGAGGLHVPYVHSTGGKVRWRLQGAWRMEWCGASSESDGVWRMPDNRLPPTKADLK